MATETLFIPEQTEPDEPELFSPAQDPAPRPLSLSAQQRYSTSLLAAMANRWNSTSDETLASITGLMEQRIDRGEEQNIRNEISDTQRKEMQHSLTAEQLDAIRNADTHGLKELIEKSIALQVAPPNQYALEEEGLANMQAAGAVDPAQAAGYSFNGDSLSNAYDQQAKYAIWNRLYNEQWAELRQQGWAESLFDMFVLPGQGTIAQYASGPKNTGALLPGYNLEEQINALNGMSLDQYKEELPRIINEIKKYSGVFAQNQGKVVELLSRLKPTSDWGDAAMANFDLGFDVATTIPFTAAAKLARKPINMIQMLGNRKGAVRTAAAAIKKDAMDLPDSKAGGLGGMTATNSGSVESAIPTYAKVQMSDYVTPWVGIPSDVTDAVRAIDEAAANIPKMSTQLTDPAAVQEAVNAHIETLQKRFRREGEDIADIHTSMVDVGDVRTAINDFSDVVDELERAVGLRPPKATKDYPGGGKVFSAHDIKAEHDAMMADFLSEAQARRVMADEEKAARLPKRPAQMSVQEIVKKYGVDWNTAVGVKRGTVEINDQGLIHMEGKPPIVNPRGVGASAYEQPKFHEPLNERREPGLPPKVVPEYQRPFRDRLDIDTDSDLGVTTVSFYLGNNARPGGYLTRELAEEGARKRGLGGFEVVESNGQHYIKVTEVVPETGSAQLKVSDDLYPVNHISQWLRNPQQALPDLINDARLASVLERGNIEANVFRPIASRIQALNPKQLRKHNKIISKGQDQQKVFNVDELANQYVQEFGRGPTDKEIIAYYAHIALNQASDAMIDDYLYTLRARGGWGTGQINPERQKGLQAGLFSDRENVRFTTNRMNMREVQTPDWSQRIFDFDENLILHPGENRGLSELRDRAKDKWNTGSYRLVELEEEVIHNGDPVRYVLVHKSSSTMGPLERRQRKSAPWGRKENLNKHFVAQSRIGKFKGATESSYALNPIIHLSERTATRARDRVEQLEMARMAWNDTDIDPVVQRQIIETAVESMEKWEQMVKDGIIQTDHPFEYVVDRELPNAYANLPNGTERWFNQEWTGSDHYYTSRRELFYQEGRDMLLDSAENRLRNLDPTRVLNRSIATAINTKAFANYNTKVIEDWSSRLPPGAIVESSVGYSKDPHTVFFHGRFSDQFIKSNPQLYKRLEANRRIHKRFINYRDEKMSLREMFNARIASWVDGKGAVKDWAATKFYDSMSRNPVDAVQGFVFDSYLGFFNPDQFFVQAQTAILAQATHPIYGVQSIAMTPWMTHLLLNRSDNLLDLYSKRLKYIHGLPPEEFKLMVKSLRESGWLKVQGSNLQLDYLTNRVGGSRIGRVAGGFRQKGRVLFNLAERYNRLTGFQIAWHDVRKHFPGLKPGTPDFMREVRKQTDALTMNMTAASKAGWQEGMAAVPTKFLAYQAHVLENLLPKSFGGSTKLRAEQKFRLAAGQLALYGLGGGYGAYSLVDYIHDSYKSATGQDMPEEVYKAATRGVMDSMIGLITGGELDTDLSSRVGWGAGMLNWWEKLTDGSFSTTVDIFGGPTATLSNNWVDAFSRISRYIRSAEVHEITAEEWALAGNDFLSSIKAWNRVSQAYAVWRLGALEDRRTRQPIIKAGEWDHVATFFGIPLGPQTEFWREMKSERKRAEIADDLANQLASLRRLGMRAMNEGDDRGSWNYNQSEGRIFDLIGDDYEMKQMVARKLSQLLGYNDYNIDALQMRIKRNQGRDLRAGGQ